jgi:tripartite-type tricarboxylate transporter receptor subunit TctC
LDGRFDRIDAMIAARAFGLIALTFFGVLTVRPAAAQVDADNFPSRAIHIVVPFPAGGPADIVARLIGQKMSEDWGRPVVIDNRPGANTIIGAQAVAKAAPDGYTLLMAIDSTLVMNPYMYRSLPYDPLADFAPITLTAKTMSLLAVSAVNGPKTAKELIARAKAQPGKLNYGGGTITTQLMGYMFNKAAGVDIVYVPFKGTPETVQGLLTGSVELVYAGTAVALPLAQSGQVRLLAKMDSRDLRALPDLPTIATAAELPGFDDLSVWLGLVAPKGTPKPIIDKLQQKVAQILADPIVKERFDLAGNYPVVTTPDEFGAFIRKETERWSKVVPETRIRFD